MGRSIVGGEFSEETVKTLEATLIMDFHSLMPNASQDKATVEAAVIALIGGAVGYFIRYYLDKQRDFASENAKIKRNAYEKYMSKSQAAISDLGKAVTDEEKTKAQEAFNKALNEFYPMSILYASPKVVKAFGDSLRYVPTNDEERQYGYVLKASRAWKAMRTDIGLRNRGLGWDGELLLRANIRDYDVTIRPYTALHRRIMRRFLRKGGRK